MTICAKDNKKEYSSLSEERKALLEKKKIERTLEAFNNMRPNDKKDFIGDTKGKDMTIKPLVYYNLQDALKNAMSDEWKTKAEKNLQAIKAAREMKGQMMCTGADLKSVQGEFGEGKQASPLSVGPGKKFIKHFFIREYCGYSCIFEIDEAPIGFGATKRNGYRFDRAWVAYYGKNGVHIGKELFLKCKFWMIRDRAEGPKKK